MEEQKKVSLPVIVKMGINNAEKIKSGQLGAQQSEDSQQTKNNKRSAMTKYEQVDHQMNSTLPIDYSKNVQEVID